MGSFFRLSSFALAKLEVYETNVTPNVLVFVFGIPLHSMKFVSINKVT